MEHYLCALRGAPGKIVCCFLFLSLGIVSIPVSAQNRHTVSGTVRDKNGDTPLAGAVVSVKELPAVGTTSDHNGAFSLTIPAGNYTLQCSFIGYETAQETVRINKVSTVQFVLKENSVNIAGIVVSSRSPEDRLKSVQTGVEKIDMAEMSKIPALFGERDIIKSIQLLPGVKSEGEGSSGYQVRGGTSSQNLILLDGAPVYNAGHLMGIFSTFNDDALSNATLYKGQIPSQFGGAVSSVFDINTKSGDMQDYHFHGSLGILSAKLYAEGPIVGDKLSFFASARRSYFDLFLKLTDDYKNTVLNFYDINAKVNYNISQRDKLFVSFFRGRDNMGLDDLMEMHWGNTTTSARWYHEFNPNLHLNTTLLNTSYLTDNQMNMLDAHYKQKGHIRHSGLKEELTWTPGLKHSLNLGLQSTWLDAMSGEWEINTLHQREKRNAWENTAWVNDEWKATPNLTVSAGVRLNLFSVMGGAPYYTLDAEGNILETQEPKSGEFVKNYLNLEPRLSLSWRLTDKQSIKAGYSRTAQNIHAIRNSSMSMPFDRYTMSTNNFKPQVADQVSLGYVALTRDNRYEFSAEAYYKNTKNVLDYKDGKSFTSEIEIERLLLSGKGRSYGLELYAKRNEGRLTGWISYTLAWSENKIPGINNDRWYDAGNDRRHDISVVGMYDLPRGWNISAAWVYNTGQALTAPSAKYDLDGETFYYYAERNGYRAPATHRLDVSATKTIRKRGYEAQWSFGIYNLYARQNPYIISFENDNTKPSGTKTMQYSLFGLLPSVSYSIKF